MYKAVWRNLMLALLSAAAVSCASTGKNISNLDSGLVAHGELEGEPEVIARADDFHQKLLNRGMVIRPDKETQAYFDQILQSLLTEQERESGVYRVYITRSPDFNAFALGNGNIYFNLGLAAGLSNSEQIAFVMAHEIEHINQRHSMATYYRVKRELTAASVFDIVLLGTKLSYLSAANNLSKHSQIHELDADLYAIERVERNGLNACVSISALDRINQIAPKRDPDKWFATHPSFEERVAQLEIYRTDDCYPADDSEEFLAMRQRVAAKAIDSMLKGHYVLTAQDTLEQAKSLLPEWQWYDLSAKASLQLSKRPKKAGKEYATWQGREFQEADALPYLEAVDSNRAKAVEMAEQGLALAPEQPSLYKTLAQALEESEFEQALSAYQRYLTLKPNGRDSKYIQHKIKRLKKAMDQGNNT